MAKKEVEYCSFCGRAEPETEMLIRGMAGNICNYCVEQANIIIEEAFGTKAQKGKPVVSGDMTLKTPQEIKKFLDQYVIGQDFTKKYSRWRYTITTSVCNNPMPTMKWKYKRVT